MSLIINAKTWSKHLKAAETSFGTFRDTLQQLFEFAMAQAANGNFTYINDLMNANLQGTDQRAGQKYIEDHNDVSLGKKDGKYAFTNNKTKGFKYVAPTKKWWEYKPTAQPTAIDPLSLVMSAVQRLIKANENKDSTSGAHIAHGKKGEAVALIKALSAIPQVKEKLVEKAAA